MKKQFFFPILLGLLISAAPVFSQEDAGTTGKVSEGSTPRGADPEIKVANRKNDDKSASKVIQPTDKGAALPRGGSCRTHLDNWTSWYLDFYVDGYYEGYIAPWGNGGVTVGGGSTRLYVKAEFDNGSWKSWGPVSRSCSYQKFTMQVYPSYYNSWLSGY